MFSLKGKYTMRIELSESQRENLRDIRKNKNISADYISEQIGKSKNWYGQIERGRQKIELNDLKLVAEVLNSSVKDLIGYMPGELSFDNENNINGLYNIKELIEENTQLKIENQILKDRLRQITNMCKID